MRQSVTRRSFPRVAALIVLTLFGGCSDSPVELPNIDWEEELPDINYIRDLSLNLSLLLVGTEADLTATLKVDLADELTLESIILYRVDEAGAPIDTLQELRDDGDSEAGDLVAADAVFAGTLQDLVFATPQSIYLSARTLATNNQTDETVENWSRRLKIDVISSELVFGSGPFSTPQGLFASDRADVTVIAGLLVADSLTVHSVKMYRVSATGDSIIMLGALRDDGNLKTGDEIQLDGNYTGVLSNVFVVAPQMYRMRALAEATSDSTGLLYKAWSPVLEVPIDWPPAQGSLDLVTSNLFQVETAYAALLAEGMTDGEAKDSVVAWMEERDFVVEAYVSPDGATVWTLYADGLEAGAYLPVDGGGAVLGGASATRKRAGKPPLPIRGKSNGRPAPLSIPTGSPFTRGMDNPDEVHSNMVSILSPLHSWIEELGETDPSAAVAALFDDKICPWAFDVTALNDSTADVNAFADLFRHGAINIITHGTIVAGGEICLMTGEPVTLEGAEAYFWDLYSSTPTMAILSFEGVANFAVKSSFIAKYNPIMPNSIIFIAACQSMLNSSMRQATIGMGAGYLAGFDGRVGVGYADEVMLEFWENVLVDGDPAGLAHDNVSALSDPENGDTDFVHFGNAVMQLSTEFQNGTFELQSLAAWRSEGDGRVIGQLGSELPTDGSYMGIVSTGLGYTLATGEIYQKVCIPVDEYMLNLKYNFFSEEFVEWCGTGFQDFFQISIIREGEAIENVLSYITIDDLCDNVEPAGVVFDQGPSESDEGVYKSGWLSLSLNCSAYAGETVTVRFAAGDIGDSIFDSAILMDSFEFGRLVN
jgi:hypothetical protein